MTTCRRDVPSRARRENRAILRGHRRPRPHTRARGRAPLAPGLTADEARATRGQRHRLRAHATRAERRPRATDVGGGDDDEHRAPDSDAERRARRDARDRSAERRAHGGEIGDGDEDHRADRRELEVRAADRASGERGAGEISGGSRRGARRVSRD